MITYLSPTSYSMFWKDRDEFYLQYIAEKRPARMPQTEPMAIGSAFDAYVKSTIHAALGGKDTRFEFDALFESQVEPHNRDRAKIDGMTAFERYIDLGGLDDHMIELALAKSMPRFEFTLSGKVNGVPLLGKPDEYFETKSGLRVILDWKVNGFYSTRNVSPAPGYISVQGPTRGVSACHKNARLAKEGGIIINLVGMDNELWCTQLAIYLWLLGEPIGTDAIAGIDQLVGGGVQRVARYRGRINADWQHELFRKISFVWDCVQSGNIFFEMKPEDAAAHMRELDMRHIALDEPFFRRLT